MKLRGMHDIPLSLGVSNRAVPANRARAVAELAGVEREKARLEQELDMWIANQKRTERRLARVCERIELLRHALDLDKEPRKRNRKSRRGMRMVTSDSNATSHRPGWREFPLEY